MQYSKTLVLDVTNYRVTVSSLSAFQLQVTLKVDFVVQMLHTLTLCWCKENPQKTKFKISDASFSVSPTSWQIDHQNMRLSLYSEV